MIIEHTNCRLERGDFGIETFMKPAFHAMSSEIRQSDCLPAMLFQIWVVINWTPDVELRSIESHPRDSTKGMPSLGFHQSGSSIRSLQEMHSLGFHQLDSFDGIPSKNEQ